MITTYFNNDTRENNTLNIEDFFSKKTRLCTISNFIDSEQLDTFLLNLNKSQPDDSMVVKMDDGYFYPFPYSTIHDKNTFDFHHPYFKSSQHFTNHHSDIIQILQIQLESYFNIHLQPLVTDEGLLFAKFNTRVLYQQKNGIDIHCENAFIPQLNPKLTHWLESKIDLQNALSFYLVLQQPEAGGELILYNQEWDNIQIEIKHESYQDRHDIEGSMFTKKGVKNISHDKIHPLKGQAVVFRAAQIWHGINKIEGHQNRITIGCFIGKGKDGNYYFWA